MTQVTFRSIAASDEPFLYRLYASTRADELNVVPWTEEQKEQFLRMQFTAQTTFYAAHFQGASFDVLEIERQPIGRLLVDRSADEIHIIDITLLPEYRGSGIGTKLLRDILDEAEAGRKRVTIHVEQFNPALRLYQRLGFQHVDSNGVYHLMEWRAAAFK